MVSVAARYKTFFCLAALLAFAFSAPAAVRRSPSPLVQSKLLPPPASGPLVNVSATGSSKFTSAEIIAATGLKVGDQVTREQMQLGANRLAATGQFSSVRYRYTSDEAGGISLQYEVVDGSTLPVTFDNFPWFTDKELTQYIRAAVGLFDGTAPAQGSYDDAIAAAIQAQLAKLGVQGHVEHILMDRLVGNGREVQFRLVGPELKVSSVEFTDPVAQHDLRIQQRLQDILGKPFSRYYLSVFITEQVRPIYLSRGNLEVRFGPPEARFFGDPNHPDLSRVTAIIPVTPGSIFHWQGATWTGNTLFNDTTLNSMLGLQPSQPADGLAIEAGWQKIRDAYGARGYLDAVLDPEPAFDIANSTAAYHVKITEGQPYTMGKLVISGLSVEAEKRVRNAWLIRAGQTFDLDYFHTFLDTLIQRALADLPVHYEHIDRLLDKNAKAHTVDVLLDFR